MTPSMIFLPGINVVCVGLITFFAISEILLVATLVKILKLTFRRQIGLYYWIVVAPRHFREGTIMEICKQGHQIFFDEMPTSLIKFSRESIRAWRIIMFHLEYRMSYFLLTKWFNELFLHIRHLRYIICPGLI
jgi:hypothetical protein